MRLVDKQIVHIPRWATIVAVTVYEGKPGLVAWVREEDHMLQPRLFRIIETGHRFASHGNLVYIGSFQIENLSAHVFEER